MIQRLYTFLFYCAQPLVWLRLLYRSRKAPDYRRRWAERYGFCRGKVAQNGILIHAVSVGETLAAVPLINTLKARYPDLPITVTTMTPTGSARVTASFDDTVSHVYLPYDLPCALNRFLTTLQPKLVIIIETELWPNLISALHKRQIPLIIANARLSDRSTRGYRRFSGASQKMLQEIPMIAAQNTHSAGNFLSLGLPESQLTVTGSIKFDIHLSDELAEQARQLRQAWAPDRLVWIAASTHDGEDDIILSTHQKLLEKHPNLLLVLVPRHAERFNAIEKQIQSRGLHYVRRSQHIAPTADTQVILGDTMGELKLLYGTADIAFIGGSLIPRGGHNPLEAALYQLPILMGEHVFNFPVICRQLADENALTFVDEFTLLPALDKLFNDSALRQLQGQCAGRVLKQNQGALDKLLTLINRFLSSPKGD